MDPISLIEAALVAGAAASAKDTASEAVKDAYAGLKTLLQRKFAGKPVAEIALAEHEKKPDIWKTPIEQGLKEAEADQDQDIIAAAQHLIQLAQSQSGDEKNTNITFQGPAQGTNIGDHNTINQTFNQYFSGMTDTVEGNESQGPPPARRRLNLLRDLSAGDQIAASLSNRITDQHQKC